MAESPPMAILVEMKEASSECHGLGRQEYHSGAESLFPCLPEDALCLGAWERSYTLSSLTEHSADLVV